MFGGGADVLPTRSESVPAQAYYERIPGFALTAASPSGPGLATASPLSFPGRSQAIPTGYPTV